jgi:uncharacterized membrane protein YfcA
MNNDLPLIFKDDVLVSIKRTLTPILVGAVAGTILGQWIDQETIQKVVGSVIAGAYYTTVRFFEFKHPGLGVLLGSRKQPIYVETVKVEETT